MGYDNIVTHPHPSAPALQLLTSSGGFTRRLTSVQQRPISSLTCGLFGEHAGKRGWKTDVCGGYAVSVPDENGALSGTVRTAECIEQRHGTQFSSEWVLSPSLCRYTIDRSTCHVWLTVSFYVLFCYFTWTAWSYHITVLNTEMLRLSVMGIVSIIVPSA